MLGCVVRTFSDVVSVFKWNTVMVRVNPTILMWLLLSRSEGKEILCKSCCSRKMGSFIVRAFCFSFTASVFQANSEFPASGLKELSRGTLLDIGFNSLPIVCFCFITTYFIFFLLFLILFKYSTVLLYVILKVLEFLFKFNTRNFYPYLTFVTYYLFSIII